MELLERIDIDPKVLAGKPVIKGTRLSVPFILGLLANGADVNEILNEYNHLTREDVLACLMFASKSLEDQLFVPLSTDLVITRLTKGDI